MSKSALSLYSLELVEANPLDEWSRTYNLTCPRCKIKSEVKYPRTKRDDVMNLFAPCCGVAIDIEAELNLLRQEAKEWRQSMGLD